MNSFIALSFFALIGCVYCEDLLRSGGSGWGYAGQGAYWPVQESNCAGERQSPIDIDTSKVYDEYTGYDLKLKQYGPDLTGKITNTGHSLQFTPDVSNSDLPSFVKGPVGEDEYKLLQFHFHWGSSNDRGSEHTIDGKSFAMEMHMVHINKKYLGDTATALTKPDGLAVIGIMFVVGGSKFRHLDPIIDAAKDLHKDSDAKIDATVVLQKFLNEVGPGYYTYDGSLTTPTCNQVVTWVVMEKAIEISQNQIDAFKDLYYKDGSPMVDNYRPPQPLNGRIVKRILPATLVRDI